MQKEKRKKKNKDKGSNNMMPFSQKNNQRSVLTKIMSLSEGENMKTQYNVLSYRIDLYFHDYMVSIETDEKEHNNRNIDYEKKGKK